MPAQFLNLLLLFSIFIPFNGFAQSNRHSGSGATTPGYTNVATSGTGTQKTKHYSPHLVARLPRTIRETSGLLFFNGQLWTHNDSGNPAEIYQLDTADGSVLRTVAIRNAFNVDWESITQDSTNIYIGDFGNNSGSRKDLCILKIRKSDLLAGAKDTVKAGYIHFYYPDQSSFAPAMNNNNFDCEAFIFQNDSLHLFSKDWSDLLTRHYTLPADTGTYQAKLVEQFNADGLITDASINAKGNLVLLGYKHTRGRSYSCFAWLLSGYKGRFYFSGVKKRIRLGSALHLGQTEGIVLQNDNSGWISAESIQAGWFYEPAKLFRFDFNNFY